MVVMLPSYMVGTLAVKQVSYPTLQFLPKLRISLLGKGIRGLPLPAKTARAYSKG